MATLSLLFILKHHVSGISLAISTYSSSRILFISFGGIDPDGNWEKFVGMLISGVPAAVVTLVVKLT